MKAKVNKEFKVCLGIHACDKDGKFTKENSEKVVRLLNRKGVKSIVKRDVVWFWLKPDYEVYVRTDKDFNKSLQLIHGKYYNGLEAEREYLNKYGMGKMEQGLTHLFGIGFIIILILFFLMLK